MKIGFLRIIAPLCFVAPLLGLAGCSTSPSSSGGTGGGTTTVAVPTIASIAPARIIAGAAATTITITGANFISGASVQVGGVVEATMYSSSTQLTAVVPASQLVSGTQLPIIVLNGASTSSTNNPVTLEVDNPSPVIAQYVPSSFAAGTSSTSLSVTGTGFVPTTSIQVNGTSRSTTYVSATQVSVILTAADLASSGSLSLTAVNPSPGGGTSAASSLPVNNPAPTATSLAPATVPAGTAAPTTVTVTGANFLPSSTVQVGSSARATAYVSATQLTFALTVADQASAARLAVSVVTPAPGGGTSAALSLNITTPTPTPVIASISPSTLLVNGPATSILVQGSNFTPSSVVQWNGTALSTTYSSNGYLYGAVPANLLTATGTASVTVSSPSAVVPVSNALPVTISNPPAPTLTSISPSYGPINTTTKVSLVGTGFTTNSVVAYNGAALTTTYNNSTSLSVTLPASANELPGNGNFTVTTPAPGGGASAAMVFSAYIPLVSNSMIYNPADGLIYASIPGSVGAPLGNSVVSVDPASGAIGTPISVGSEPNKLALSSDGKVLWVTLDGSSGVRRVDLVAKTAGLQFSIQATNTGIYNAPAAITAIAALPGSTTSVVLSTSNATTPYIYDNGLLRGTAPSTTNYLSASAFALQVDGTRNEIYAAGSAYNTFLYSAAGITSKASNTSIAPATASYDEIQLLSGRLYTDQGRVYDAESGALLGTIYLTGTTAAQGTTFADASLGKIFVLDSASGNYSGTYNQIQIFNTSDYTATGASIPVNAAGYITPNYASVSPSRLTRWGANGLLFHTGYGIYSLRSNSIADLSASSADLGLTLTTTGATTTGTNTTFTLKVTNSGASTSTETALALQPPTIGSVLSIVPGAGSCSLASMTCSLGTLASGSSVSVVVTVLQTTAGTSTLSAQVSSSLPDPVSANNSASASVTITGSDYSLTPTLFSLAPSAIQAGASDTLLTVNGVGFSSSSTVQLGGSALQTTFVSATRLTATVPAARLTTLGWSTVSVSTPAPGGGASNSLPLSIFNVLTVGVNHILYDPYSRQIMASVGSGSSSVTGNSIAAITPETGAISTPVSIGSQPTSLALSSDGQILYTILTGSQSIARFNMLTRQADFTYTPPSNSSFVGGIALRGIAVQPGTENTIALDIASFTGNAIYDFNPTTKTAAIRGQASGPYSGSCIQFLDASNLLAFDTDTSGFSLDHYTVTAAGFTYYNYQQYTESTLNHFGCFKLSGGLAFANAGGIANPATSPAVQVATLPNTGLSGGFSIQQAFAPDASLQRAFYPAATTTTTGTPDGIAAFDLSSYLLSSTLPLNMATIEGGTSYSPVDMVRWGQDGLAILTSGGHIYLLRGPAVAPQLLNLNSAATLTSISTATVAHGTGNTLLTLTGSNFIPGVAVTLNGAYRTTTILDATHVTVAIPAGDLAAAGSASLVATNPGAPASSALTLTIN